MAATIGAPIIDAHTHIAPRWAELALRVMDHCGVRTSVNLGWQDAFGAGLLEQLAVFGRWPERFIQLGNLDWRGVDRPDWGARQAEALEAAVEAGAGGLKIFKNLGLEVRDSTGELLRVDDRRLDPVFERAGKLGVPVLIHTADPSWFWRPPDQHNFWSGVLQGPYLEWSYYRKGFPSREELLAERDNLLRRHRGTTFVAPHLASLSDDPLALDEALEAHPNLYADISARLPAMARTPRRRNLWREVLIRHCDRILFGTDLIYLDSDVATGIQSQSFQRPEDLERPVGDPEKSYEQTSTAYLASHLEFLAGDSVQPRAPFRRREGTFRLEGLGLPAPELESILSATPARVYRVRG